MSIARKKNPNYYWLGKKRTKEFCKKMSIIKMGTKNMLGKHHTEESKKKMSKAHKGRIFTEEHKVKISNALLRFNKNEYGK